MGYELTYEDRKFYVWSTIIDDYISGPLDSPSDVANFILNKPPETKKDRQRIYKIWYDEAVKVQSHPEEGLRIIGTLDISGLKEGREPFLRKYEDTIRMTPRLKKLQERYRKTKEDK